MGIELQTIALIQLVPELKKNSIMYDSREYENMERELIANKM